MNNSDDFHSSELEAEVAKVLETDHLKLWDTQVKKAKKNTVPWDVTELNYTYLFNQVFLCFI